MAATRSFPEQTAGSVPYIQAFAIWKLPLPRSLCRISVCIPRLCPPMSRCLPPYFPGDGFSPTGSPWERKYSLKSLISFTVSSNSSFGAAAVHQYRFCAVHFRHFRQYASTALCYGGSRRTCPVADSAVDTGETVRTATTGLRAVRLREYPRAGPGWLWHKVRAAASFLLRIHRPPSESP